MIINAPILTDKAEALVKLVPYNNQTGEMFPGNKVSFAIDDILTLAASDADLANTCNVLFNTIDRLTKQNNLI